MPAVTTSDEFLRVLRQSSLVEELALTTSLEQLKNGTPPAEPRELATHLCKQGILTTFQAKQLLSGKSRGFAIGKYRVLEPLGAGGMGQVFLCEHRQMRRLVAVKVLSAQQLSERSAVERFC
jgi:eukaryotic-like serine/threonine-protein kinase